MSYQSDMKLAWELDGAACGSYLEGDYHAALRVWRIALIYYKRARAQAVTELQRNRCTGIIEDCREHCREAKAALQQETELDKESHETKKASVLA